MKEVKMLECSVHGVTEHVMYNGRYRCKKCFVHYNNEKRKKYKNLLVEYKGGKCEICGYDKCVKALEFHHINKETKKFSISDNAFNRSLDELKKEVDKCILVCANCHRELHDKEEIEKYKNIDFTHKTAIDKIDYEKLKELLSEGKKQKEIAEFFGVSISTIKRYLKKNIGM